MKAAAIVSKPGFQLLKLTDIISFYHIQIPRWLFADPQYRTLSSEAKLAYSLLLNRHQLSRLNNWVNDDGEVFIVYTRKELAADLCISDRKSIQCMQELNRAMLIWERRCGRGEANQIYLAKVELTDEAALTYCSAPFEEPRPADAAPLDHAPPLESVDNTCSCADSRSANTACLDVPFSVKSCENGSSTAAESAAPDVQNPHPNNTYLREKERESLSVSQKQADRRTDEDDLLGILDKCSLWMFPPRTATVFESAIERLYYSESFKVGNAVLPQSRIRARLRQLNDIMLQEAQGKIAANTQQQVKNSTAYVMAVVFNSITEVDSDIMSDPYLNSLSQRSPPGKGGG